MRAGQKRAPIDWAAARARLAGARARTEAALAPGPDRQRAVLDERARVLALPEPIAPPADAMVELLVFSLGAIRYAIESSHVREVVRASQATPVPGAPPFVHGLIQLRGEILMVVDLRRLDGEPAGLSDLTRVLVLGGHPPDLGLLADEAHELRSLPRRALRPPPPPGPTARRGPALCGITDDGLLVLDAAALQGDPALDATDGADQARASTPP
jgi:purine-binding chemotaxis protein CheW